MDSPSQASNPGRRYTSRKTVPRAGGPLYASEQAIEAYLQARDAVRRIQRISALVGAASQRAPGSAWRVPGRTH